MQSGGVFVERERAAALGLSFDDELSMEFAIGQPALFTVVGTFEQDGALIEPFDIDSSFPMSFGATRYEVGALTISLPDAAPPAGAISRLDEAACDYPRIEVQDRYGYAAQSATRIDQIILVDNGLLALTPFIALVGVADPMALAVAERRREITMLRSIGLTRRQVRSTVRW
ncbi:MAG: putative ABC transport system permease protein [Candidatus Aldehydirespiratoraceae bacterium]